MKAGGGIVVAGEGWYSPLRVLMDVEVDSAFPVETITLLVSCLIAEGEGDIKIGSDCKGAMAAVNKKNIPRVLKLPVRVVHLIVRD